MGIGTASGVLYTENIPSVIRQREKLECVVTVWHFTTLAVPSSSPSHRRQYTPQRTTDQMRYLTVELAARNWTFFPY